MKVMDFDGRLFSGEMGEVVYYVMNGQVYARKKRRRMTLKEKEELSPRVKEANTRFRVAREMYSDFRKQVSGDIWRLAGREVGRMGHNLFHSMNCGCLDGEGRVVAPENFHFSAGSLELPRGLRLEEVGEGVYRARWEDEREQPTASAGDVLRVGVLYEPWCRTFYLAKGTGGCRGDGVGEFRLERGRVAHVYVFFGRADGRAYSPSRHFRVEVPGGENGEER